MSLSGFIAYQRVGWTGQTPWNPTNLNIMDKGIKDNNDMIANLRSEVSALNNNLTDEGQYGIVVNFSSEKFKGYTRAPYNFKLRKKYTVQIISALKLADSTEYKDSIQSTVNNGLVVFYSSNDELIGACVMIACNILS